MKIELMKWDESRKPGLIRVCNEVDRSYLSDRLPYPYTEKDADWWLGMAAEGEGTEGIFRAIVADGEVVGNISVERKADVYRKDGEIGYLLRTDYWSKGIMTKAVRQICPIAFEKLELLRITGLVYSPNQASRRVLEKNGFTLEGLMRDGVYKDGKVYDLCVYGKTR